MTLTQKTFEAPTAVYRFYDGAGTLLYVGIAIDPDVRHDAHAREKAWWRDVDHRRTRIAWCPDRYAAIDEENRAIETENPLYNVTGTMNPPQLKHTREPRSYDNMHPIRIPKEVWDGYADIVGNCGRSADLKAYINWRIDNPTTPLPGRRRGPIKKARPAPPPAEI